MSARDYLRSAIASGIDGPHTESLLDAFIAEVLNEAANGLAALGLVDSLVSGPQAWTEAIETLRRMAAAGQATAPQPGAAALAHGGLTALSWWQHQTPPTAAPAPQPETAPDAPAVGDRYDSRHGGEGVTVTRLWALDNGHRAVDFEYRDGESSALPLDSFRRAYQPETEPAAIEEFEAQHPDAMKTARQSAHAPARPRARRTSTDTPGAES